MKLRDGQIIMASRSLSAQQIVDEFKRSGKFDKLRRDSIEAFLTSVCLQHYALF